MVIPEKMEICFKMYSKTSSALWSQNYIEISQYFLFEMNKRLQIYLQTTNNHTTHKAQVLKVSLTQK